MTSASPSSANSGGASLPVRLVRAELMAALAGAQSVILTAETGSGKTTQVPQMLAGAGAVTGEILVLEPRRLAARLSARRVAQEMGVPLGGRVGFQTRFERAWSAETRIGFLTEGVLIRRMLSDPSLRGVGAVILDEFHERSILVDLALGLVRRLQEGARRDLKLVLMSATLDAERLGAALHAPCIHAEGRTFPVEIIHRAPGAGSRPWDEASAALDDELDRGSEGDILIFMPGAFEIDRTVETVSARLRARGAKVGEGAGPSGFAVLPLHGAMPPARQDDAVTPRQERRVIVATNVAQTSITIEGVRLVIDSGTARVHRHDPRRVLDSLVLEPISRAAAEQRSGRAGRTSPGRCVRLWSEQDHARREAYDPPEIARVDLAEAMLTVAAAAGGGFERFPWVDAPPAEAVERARACLFSLGAIDAAGSVTSLGRRMASLPLHPRLARAMVEATERGCVARTAKWCALAAERDFVERGDAPQLLEHLQKSDPPSDLIVRERLLERLEREDFARDRLGGVQVNLQAAREISRAARAVAAGAAAGAAVGAAAGASAGAKAAANGAADSLQAASLSLVAGFPDFVCFRPDRQRPHAFLPGRRKVQLDRDSLVRAEGFALALEIRADPRDPTTQLLSMLTPLERSWLEGAWPQRFTTRVEQRWNPAARAVEEVEELCFDGIAIEATSRPPRNAAEAARVLVERIAASEIQLPQWDESVEQWITRVRCVRSWFPDRTLLAYDDQDLAVIRSEIVSGAVRASQLADRPCLEAVKGALDWEDRRFVEKMAPAELPLPSGRRLKLRYEIDRPPRGAARIQDLYECGETPTVAGGRVAVLLEITGPNSRPLQVTSDLKGFWERLYPTIRAELKRRYPKHEWR